MALASVTYVNGAAVLNLHAELHLRAGIRDTHSLMPLACANDATG
jgi:hypothetical protein